jgi:hypothetical protein
MPSITCSIAPAEIQKLTRAFRAVAAATQKDSRDVLRSFAGVVLKTWAGRTKVVTEKKTDERTHFQVVKSLGLTKAPDEGDVSVNAGRKGLFGRVWVRTANGFRCAGQIAPDGSGFRPVNYHWKSGTWTDISEAVVDVCARLPNHLTRGRAAIGLARQSVVQIADALHIDLARVQGGGTFSAAGIAKARAALATSGKRYTNGLGQEENSAKGIFLTLINNYPLAEKLEMDRTLAGVLSGQVKYFERNMEEGVFTSIKKIAAAYPFLKAVA